MYNKENTKEAEDILARISAELIKQKKPQAELITFLDLPKGTYSAWKAGRSRNYCEHLHAISSFLGVSAEYLVTGEKEANVISDRIERELINTFRELDDEKQDAIMQIVRLL